MRPVLRDNPTRCSSRRQWPARRKVERDRSQRHTLRSRIADGLLVKMIGSSHQENQREQKPSQNDHCTLPKACCLHILGNCDRIGCHVLPPFVCWVRLVSTKIDCAFVLNQRERAFSEAGNLLEPTPTTWLAAGLLFFWRARFGRANRNLSMCAPENN